MLSIIAATDKNGLIGNGDKIPWYLPKDFAYFKKTTMGNPVFMGSVTYWSLPEKFRPLPGRENIIFSRKGNRTMKPLEKGGHEIVILPEDIRKVIAMYDNGDENFLIGGEQIYTLLLKMGLVDKIYLTEIDGEFEGDIYFPIHFLKIYREVSRVHHPKDNENKYDMDFVVYEKIDPVVDY